MHEGASTKDIKALSATSINNMLTFTGWAGFKKEILMLGYAFDCENPVFNTAPTNTSEKPIFDAGGSLAKRFTVNADISKLTPGEHIVYLLALVNIDGGKAVKLMEFTLTLSEQCPHNTADEKGWSAIPGEAKETATCAGCGEALVRDTMFRICVEEIAHAGGKKTGTVHTLDTPLNFGDVSNAFVADKGLYIQGWLGINSGTLSYKWSVNGTDWFDVDDISKYTDSPQDVLNAIANDDNISHHGFKDYSHKVRFHINISGIANLEAGNYTVYLGAVPNNNPDTVVSIVTIENVSVFDIPEDGSALKSINNFPISDYKIEVEGTGYGAQYAKTILIRDIYALSDILLTDNEDTSTKTILIKNSDTFSNGQISGGEYFFEIDDDKITIGGSGMYGPIKAVDAFIEAISGKADATVESTTDSILKLNNVKAKLENGEALNVGFIGDSVTYGHGPVTPWPTYFEYLVKNKYTTIKTSNVAVAGTTSKWGNENIKSLLLDSGFNDLVFLSHGTNDKYYNVTYQDTYDNYISMIEQIRSSNPESDIVFVVCSRDFEQKGIIGISGGSISPYMMAMIDVAREYGIGIIDPMTTLYEAGEEHSSGNATVDGWKYYMQDEVHPNELGQELYGEVVYQYVAKALE